MTESKLEQPAPSEPVGERREQIARIVFDAIPPDHGSNVEMRFHWDLAYTAADAILALVSPPLGGVENYDWDRHHSIVGIIREHVRAHHYAGDPTDYWTIIGEDEAARAMLSAAPLPGDQMRLQPSASAPGGEVEAWRSDMENAPRDGTRFQSQDRINFGERIFEGTHWYSHPSVTGWNTDDLDCGDYEWEPTHWRPLPAPPSPEDMEPGR